MDKKFDEIHEVLLYEVRENRKEIVRIRSDFTKMKVKIAVISVFLGAIGGKLSLLLPFLR